MAMPDIVHADLVRQAVEKQEQIAVDFKVEQFVSAGNKELQRMIQSFDNSLLSPPRHITITGGAGTSETTVQRAAKYFEKVGYKTEVKYSPDDYHNDSYYYLVVSF